MAVPLLKRADFPGVDFTHYLLFVNRPHGWIPFQVVCKS
jgi:hypothetical protein